MKMNGKSLEFVRKRIESGNFGEMKNDNYKHMREIDFRAIADKVKFNEYVKVFDGLWEVEFLVRGTGETVKLSVKYNSDAEFDYFSSKSCLCDGTFAFFINLCEEIFERILSGQSVYMPKTPEEAKKSPQNYDICFEVGNFVFAEEYGEQFAPEDKPWMKSRFTVMLPIKCDFIRRDS